MNYEKNKSRQLCKQQMANKAAEEAAQLVADPYQPNVPWPRTRVENGEYRPVDKSAKLVVTVAEVNAKIKELGLKRCTARKRRQIAQTLRSRGPQGPNASDR